MRIILLSLVLGVLGCAIDPKISRMEHYSKEYRRPIIYGSISGIPDAYSFTLHFEYKDLKGQAKRVSRDFDETNALAKEGVFKYTFFLPSGHWTLRQIDLKRMQETGDTNLLTRSPNKTMAVFKMRDSLATGLTFEVAKDGLYYLGRWTFGGLEFLNDVLPEAIARFNASRKNKGFFSLKPICDSSWHSISISLDAADSGQSDHAYFTKRHSGLKAKKSLQAIPTIPIEPNAYRFDLVVADPESPPIHPNHGQQFPPSIPKHF